MKTILPNPVRIMKPLDREQREYLQSELRSLDRFRRDDDRMPARVRRAHRIMQKWNRAQRVKRDRLAHFIDRRVMAIREEILFGDLNKARKMIEKARRGEGAFMSKLTFDDLRRANIERLPQFRNKHGVFAHTKRDGSDWDRAAWLEALVGEVGEYANKSKKYRRGDISHREFMAEAKSELADIQTYLDLLAHSLGIDLAQATIDKFNVVSYRVRSDVRLSHELGAHLRVVTDSAWNHLPLSRASEPFGGTD